MIFSTQNFYKAYNSYFDIVNREVVGRLSVLEIGGGAHPSIKNRKGVEYFIVDPDPTELEKAPIDIKKINLKVQDLKVENKFDLILSKMVLEHIQEPDSFHKNILELLEHDGIVVHFFACRHSIPAMINRFFPEFVGDLILRMIGNRHLEESPKYKAFYKNTKGHIRSQIEYFENLGYKIQEYHSFVGHKYLQKIPILAFVERRYNGLLTKLKAKNLTTVALIVLSKP